MDGRVKWDDRKAFKVEDIKASKIIKVTRCVVALGLSWGFDNIIIYFSINSFVKLYDPCIYFLLDFTYYFELIENRNSTRMKWRVHNIEMLLSDNVCDMPALFKDIEVVNKIKHCWLFETVIHFSKVSEWSEFLYILYTLCQV